MFPRVEVPKGTSHWGGLVTAGTTIDPWVDNEGTKAVSGDYSKIESIRVLLMQTLRNKNIDAIA